MKNTDRAGIDHLAVGLIILAFILWIIGANFWNPLIFVGWGVLLLTYIRSMSTNKARRHQENIQFLKYWYPIQSKMTNEYRRFQAKREHRYFKCKTCKQKLRVPRKLNRVQVTCPKCRNSFIKESLKGKVLRRLQPK